MRPCNRVLLFGHVAPTVEVTAELPLHAGGIISDHTLIRLKKAMPRLDGIDYGMAFPPKH